MNYLRALIVSEIDGRRTLADILGRSHFDCVETGDGISALQFASECGLDLIAMSLDLPRMGGVELAHLAARGVFGADPPPIFMIEGPSAAGIALKDEDWALFAACISRPFDAAQIEEALAFAFPEA